MSDAADIASACERQLSFLVERHGFEGPKIERIGRETFVRFHSQLSPETTAGFSYEEDRGAISVTVIDRYGDGHIHILILGNLTKAEALRLLARKQAEFGHGK